MKIGLNEVEIEGTTSDIEKTIELIPAMLQALPEEMLNQQPRLTLTRPDTEYNRLDNFTSSTPSQSAQSSPQPQQSHSSVFPEIHVEKGDSLSDIITKLFTDSWGRNPRKLGDVRDALQSYGQVYPKQSVAVALLRLAQSGKLRRFKSEGGEFVYTASTSLSSEDPGRITPIQS
ncbi:MAG: hypothetical protein M1503_02290 [Thaumarchaeota archaeon]|nr:hypothetical protein [Nitrososphaerota archaeon]